MSLDSESSGTESDGVGNQRCRVLVKGTLWTTELLTSFTFQLTNPRLASSIMARSRRSSPASSSARKPAPAAPAKAPAPAPAAPAPAPAPAAQPSSGGMMSGLMGTVAEGMAWGTGTAIARHAVNAVVDSFSGDSKEAPAAAAPVAAAPAAAAPANACFNDQKAFMDCLNANKNDISSCQLYLDAFNSCKQQSTFL